MLHKSMLLESVCSMITFFLNIVLKNFIILCYKLEMLFYKYIPEIFVLYFKVDFLTSLSCSISSE